MQTSKNMTILLTEKIYHDAYIYLFFKDSINDSYFLLKYFSLQFMRLDEEINIFGYFLNEQQNN